MEKENKKLRRKHSNLEDDKVDLKDEIKGLKNRIKNLEEQVNKHLLNTPLPSSEMIAKGIFVKKLSVSSTMGAGVRIDSTCLV